jgi:hypothetical protein
MRKNTLVPYRDRFIKMSSQAQVCDDGNFYEAHALDEDENEYMIYWPVINHNYHDGGDESDACDWDDYEITKL